jgi:hypothetical protein
MITTQPVRGRLKPVKDTRGSQQHCPRAHRRRPLRGLVRSADPTHVAPILGEPVAGYSARNDQDRRRGQLFQTALGDHLKHAVVGAHRPRICGQEDDACAGQPTEDLVRPYRIQCGEVLIDRDGDIHDALLRPAGSAPA